jgi:hypothetical protein
VPPAPESAPAIMMLSTRVILGENLTWIVLNMDWYPILILFTIRPCSFPNRLLLKFFSHNEKHFKILETNGFLMG